MTVYQDYWTECISIAAEECDLKLTQEQLEYLASAVESGHDYYGMSFYSPPDSEYYDREKKVLEDKLKALQAEFDRYKGSAETAVKQALRVHRDDNVSIEAHGEVLLHAGRSFRIQ